MRLHLDGRLAPADGVALRRAWLDWAGCAGIGLRFAGSPPGGTVPDAPAPHLPDPFPATPASLQGLPPDVVRDRLTAPLRQLEAALAPEPQRVTVAVLPDLVPASSAAATLLPELAGLGLPVAAGRPGPLVLLSARVVLALPRAARASAVGHELGHAFGLGHDTRPCNLMAPSDPACGVGWLDAAQAARLAAASGLPGQ